MSPGGEPGVRAVNAGAARSLGRWLKGRRPRMAIERIDAELITRYIANCSSFRAKATVYGTLSTMHGFGDFLVRQGLWKINPLRWISHPTVAPKRIDHAHMEAVWPSRTPSSWVRLPWTPKSSGVAGGRAIDCLKSSWVAYPLRF